MKETAKNNLKQLQSLLEKLNDDAYNARPEVLFGASIGEHFRHILEFYLLLVSGSFTGLISYDRRKRDARIANSRGFALEAIQHIMTGIDTLDLDLLVHLEADYSSDWTQDNHIPTSVARELGYCIEHSIHHQALIKTGLIALECHELVDERFGVAYSTIRYRGDRCAQ